MCGIAGILNLENKKYPNVADHLKVMNAVQAHRGPDGEGIWIHARKHIGFGHKRLSIIDLKTGSQPMKDEHGNVISYNGEIYNFIELRQELKGFTYRTSSDTEVILAAYKKWGPDCISHFRGMFSFALWDESKNHLFCARDRFGIKPFYYTVVGETFYFASEAKALLPFLPEVKINREALKDYLVFQFCLKNETLFEGISELAPAHYLIVKNGDIAVKRYWEVYYQPDFSKSQKCFEEELRESIQDSINIHTRSDVPIGAYISGGIDSSLVASVALDFLPHSEFKGFTGKFPDGDLYDESRYAHALADMKGMTLHEIEINSRDFIETIRKIIYHLDYPAAGPGSFPQYHVSKLASQYRKVVLGGQGGDEIFGGYTRYIITYFEQCIKAAIDGTMHNGNFIVTYESIIPNLVALKNYKPLLQKFWEEGLFDDMDKRYFHIINRASNMQNEVNWEELGSYDPFEEFRKIFNRANVGKESYFDKMTHFDFKTLLPALLQVEDRMSMAHGLESRVPFLDHPIVELAATMPSNIKFKDGTLKMILVNAMKDKLPDVIKNRKDKMGFPVPLDEWLKNDIKDFVFDVFSSRNAKSRPYVNNNEIIKNISKDVQFGRKAWGLLSLELWHQEFIDRQLEFKKLLKRGASK